MRLIDADTLTATAERAHRAWMRRRTGAENERDRAKAYKMQELCKAVNDVADRCPTVDAEAVVRCKDCAHLLREKMLCLHPGNRVFHTGPKTTECHFCSYGERKENGKET